jgi:hypothetical protein
LRFDDIGSDCKIAQPSRVQSITCLFGGWSRLIRDFHPPLWPSQSFCDYVELHHTTLQHCSTAVCAVALFGIFLVSVILRLVPPRLFDPLWQVSLTTALLDMGGYALLGVVVLTLAHLFEPDDSHLR